YRRLYFIRRVVATLVEFRSALMRLDQCPEFLEIKNKFSSDELKDWKEALSFFDTHKDILKNARDDIGGHYLERASDYALKNIKPEAVAQIELVKGGKDGVAIKLRFAGELAATALTAHRGEKTTEDFIYNLVWLTR